MSDPPWARVEELFHAALERAPEDREVFLHEACGADEDLRREVLSLLAEQRSADRMMERPAASAVTQRLAIVRGTRLGPYEVEALLGAGGMGEVYRARDTRLGREVAVKVLPADFASDPERLRRFEREARAVASLSHPHIASLFDVGQAEGTRYLVMELVDGETLAARLKHKPLAREDALRVGAEIADALAAAHGQGVVHRDVKPANVMLTRSGAKLLDFGLARRTAAAGRTAMSVTEAGLVAGTLPYMSPEQLEGREADARTDIWALGCVVFEMLSGRRAFDGDSQARLIAAIEKDEPPRLAQPAVSPALDQLVRQCLKKDPARRWQSAADVALRLREIAEAENTADPPAAKGRRSPPLPIVAAAAVALVAGALAGRQWLPPPVPADAVVRSEIELPATAALATFGMYGEPSATRTELALSPDGRLLVWSGRPGGGRGGDSSLHTRSLETGEVRQLPETATAEMPFFSPDGRWIGFYSTATQALRKVPASGGLAVDIVSLKGADVPVGSVGPIGADWAKDGRIYLGSRSRGGIASVPADGGALTDVTRVERLRESGHRLPRALPGGKWLLFTAMPTDFGLAARIEAVSLSTGARKVIVDDAADPRYLPTGHLLFVRQGSVMAAPLDLERAELLATPVPVIAGVQQALNMGNSAYNSGAGQLALSDAGLLVYAPGGVYVDAPAEFVLASARGVEPLAEFERPLCTGWHQFSPDGRQLAFVERAKSGLVWSFDVERHTYRPLTRDGVAGSIAWSPDSRRLVAGWAQQGLFNLWSIPAEEEGEWERLTTGAESDWPSSWSPDGQLLAFVRGREIFLYRFADRQALPFITRAPEGRRISYGYPVISPDGRRLAYVSDETGTREVYITSFPERRQSVVVSRDGGLSPAWSRDGRRLYYVSTGRGAVMAVPVGGGETLSLGLGAAVLPLPERVIGLRPVGRVELHPDGRRVLFARMRASAPIPPVTRLRVVQHWFTELERSSPVQARRRREL